MQQEGHEEYIQQPDQHHDEARYRALSTADLLCASRSGGVGADAIYGASRQRGCEGKTDQKKIADDRTEPLPISWTRLRA